MRCHTAVVCAAATTTDKGAHSRSTHAPKPSQAPHRASPPRVAGDQLGSLEVRLDGGVLATGARLGGRQASLSRHGLAHLEEPVEHWTLVMPLRLRGPFHVTIEWC